MRVQTVELMFLVGEEKGLGRALRVLCVFRAFQYISPDWPDLARLVPLPRATCLHYSINRLLHHCTSTKPAYQRPLPSETAVVPVEALAPLIQTSCWHRESHSSPCGGVSRPLHPLRTMRATPANTTSQWPPKHLPAGSRLPLRSPWAPPSPHSAGK